MKQILLCACAALLFAGCAKENIFPAEGNDNQKGDITLSFTASQNGFGTKAVIGDTTTDEEGHKSTAINWQITDQITVFDGAGENCVFSTKDFSTEAASCTFEGNVTELAADYTAVYPYTEAATIAEGVISGITLPATQTAVEGSFDTKAALMAAKTVDGGRDLDFKNLVGYVKVATDFDCKKIELQAASGEALAGAGSITFDAKGNPVLDLEKGAVSSITLTAEDGGTITADKTYYIAVPAQTLAAGWSISFTATDGKVYKRKAAKQIVFKKNTVVNLGTVKLEDFFPYVTFSAESEQTFTMNFYGDFSLGSEEFFEYRVGNGDWICFTTTISEIPFGGSKGDLQLRGISSKGTGYLDESADWHWCKVDFSTNSPVECTGDIRTLVDYTNYSEANTSNAGFVGLFENCTVLTSAPELPTSNLASDCYSYMFSGCTALATAPQLPATVLAEYCYSCMFSGCTALTTAPQLPATVLAEGCYSGMFEACTSLTSAPALPAQTLSNGCYTGMFSGCSALKTAPALPADKLAQDCYTSMFKACTSLTSAPALPAKELAESCYTSMFEACTSLRSAQKLPAQILSNGCYRRMFYGCSALETAPELPATTLAEACYMEMFTYCKSLTIAPDLPAPELSFYCYRYMFEYCSRLSSVKIMAKTYEGKTFDEFSSSEINEVKEILLNWLPTEFDQASQHIIYCTNEFKRLTQKSLFSGLTWVNKWSCTTN